MGAIVVVEGIDGSGKSTVCERVSGILRSEGIEAVATSEPTREGIGAFIRSGAAGSISQAAESLLFAADRFEHTVWMERERDAGKVILCGRYYPSTLAYQASNLGGDSAAAEWLEAVAEPFVRVPDAVILLDLDPEISMARVGSRGEEKSKFESADFLSRVRESYLSLADRFGFETVDASRSSEEVAAEVAEIVREVI